MFDVSLFNEVCRQFGKISDSPRNKTTIQSIPNLFRPATDGYVKANHPFVSSRDNPRLDVGIICASFVKSEERVPASMLNTKLSNQSLSVITESLDNVPASPVAEAVLVNADDSVTMPEKPIPMRMISGSTAQL